MCVARPEGTLLFSSPSTMLRGRRQPSFRDGICSGEVQALCADHTTSPP